MVSLNNPFEPHIFKKVPITEKIKIFEHDVIRINGQFDTAINAVL